MAELAQPHTGHTDLEQRNILRWEDDGGQIFEPEHRADHSRPDPTLGNHQLMTLPSKEEVERLQRY